MPRRGKMGRMIGETVWVVIFLPAFAVLTGCGQDERILEHAGTFVKQ